MVGFLFSLQESEFVVAEGVIEKPVLGGLDAC